MPALKKLAVALLALGAVPLAGAQTVHTQLEGYQEVPVVSTAGNGSLRLKIDADGGAIFYELQFGDLQGTVTQAHIHFGQRSVNGGIAAWLCGTASNPGPAGTPVCPAGGGSVTGTIMAGNVVGPAGQLIAAGEFTEFVNAIRAGVTYANVHSTLLPGGEIRGQIPATGHTH